MNKPLVGEFSSFAFPLNVYAAFLTWETGELNYLHYGLFTTPDSTPGEAQERSSELVFTRLPPLSSMTGGPPRILEVGIGLGTTLNRLVRTGYTATGITPDAAQVAFAKARHGDALPAQISRLEDFPADRYPEYFDCLLFQESAQYIDMPNLFNQAARLLAPGGEILVIDEFALRREQAGPENLHFLPHFTAQAERNGFDVVEKLDLSLEAAPTVDALLDFLERWRQRLIDELDISEAQIDHLKLANEDYRQKYASGRYGYFLLRLRRTGKESEPRWRVGLVGAPEINAIRQLFADVFDHELSETHWRWKYGNGHGVATGVWENGRLIAHYGGWSRAIRYHGEKQWATQPCDVMVAPSGRGTLSRQGPLFLMISTFAECFLGYGTRHLVAFGAANERAHKAPHKLGIYGEGAGHFVEVEWIAATRRPSLNRRVREVTLDSSECRAAIDTLWPQMAADFRQGIIGERDFAYLDYRFRQHPATAYRFFLVSSRLSNEPLALLILAARDKEGVELVDMLAPLAHLPLAVKQARRIVTAIAPQNPRLFCWILEHHTRHLPEGRIRQLPAICPDNNWTAGPPPEMVRGQWWLMGGDLDFR